MSNRLGPNSYDCSGLVFSAYKQVGITVPSTSEGYKSHINSNKEISWNKIEPGDIVHILASERRGNPYGHVAIYIGNNEIVEAKGIKWGVVKSKLDKTRFKHVFKFIND